MTDALATARSEPERSGLVLLRQSGLRAVSETEARASLAAHLVRLPAASIDADMRAFSRDVELDQWQPQDRFLRGVAADVLANAAKMGGSTAIHYFGLAEVPHAVTLGAHIGDEVPVSLYEWNRESGVWETGGTAIDVSTEGLPLGPPVAVSGVAVVRIEVSARIADGEVHEAAGQDILADVRIAVAEPQAGLVQGSATAELVRVEVRKAFSILQNHFPKLRQIHLFVAAPTSVCFAAGQAIKPRNSVPCRTYRFRIAESRPRQQPAILIRLNPVVEAPPLSAEDRLLAADLRRDRAAPALQRVQAWAAQTADWESWFAGMSIPQISTVAPFPTLPPLGRVVGREDGLFPDDVLEFSFSQGKWLIGDRLLVSWHRQFGRESASLDRVLRIFFAHEYIHRFQGVSGSLATGIGRFGLCLEHVDYVADAYALLHEAAFEPGARDLSDLVDEMLQSLWAFDIDSGINWPVRRLRRYLNWYWQWAVLHNRPQSPPAILATPPRIEMAGLDQFLEGPRHMVNLETGQFGRDLELAIVIETGELVRLPSAPTLPLAEMVGAFIDHNHERLKSLFLAVFEHAKPRQHVRAS